MGLSAWYFLRTAPGEVQTLQRTALNAFVSGEGRLPAEPDCFVRYAEVLVSLDDRVATEIVSIGFHQIRALADGTLDKEHWDAEQRLVWEAAFSNIETTPTPGVIDARPQFARRRHEHVSQWKPTKGELHALYDLINKKARRELVV